MQAKEHKELKEAVGTLEKRFSILERSVLQIKILLEQFIEFATAKFSALDENKADKKDVEEIVERVAGRKIDKVLTILDAQSKYFQESEMLAGQVNRHDRWIHKIADQTNTKLEY